MASTEAADPVDRAKTPTSVIDRFYIFSHHVNETAILSAHRSARETHLRLACA